MRISDWSSDVCSSDLRRPSAAGRRRAQQRPPRTRQRRAQVRAAELDVPAGDEGRTTGAGGGAGADRLQPRLKPSLLRLGEARVVRRGLCFWLACRKTFAARGKSSRLKPLPQGPKQRPAASAAPTRLEESMHSLLILNFTFGAPPKRRGRRTDRSEERRVGKEGVGRCRSGWSRYH